MMGHSATWRVGGVGAILIKPAGIHRRIANENSLPPLRPVPAPHHVREHAHRQRRGRPAGDDGRPRAAPDPVRDRGVSEVRPGQHSVDGLRGLGAAHGRDVAVSEGVDRPRRRSGGLQRRDHGPAQAESGEEQPDRAQRGLKRVLKRVREPDLVLRGEHDHVEEHKRIARDGVRVAVGLLVLLHESFLHEPRRDHEHEGRDVRGLGGLVHAGGDKEHAADDDVDRVRVADVVDAVQEDVGEHEPVHQLLVAGDVNHIHGGVGHNQDHEQHAQPRRDVVPRPRAVDFQQQRHALAEVDHQPDHDQADRELRPARDARVVMNRYPPVRPENRRVPVREVARHDVEVRVGGVLGAFRLVVPQLLKRRRRVGDKRPGHRRAREERVVGRYAQPVLRTLAREGAVAAVEHGGVEEEHAVLVDAHAGRDRQPVQRAALEARERLEVRVAGDQRGEQERNKFAHGCKRQNQGFIALY